MTKHSLNPKVDAYFKAGCGRCPPVNTPECRVNNWQAEMKALRTIILDCGLNEELKWSIPCYTHQKRNILLLSAFKKFCSINFFKGALLKDADKILTKPGENSQAARQIRFTDVRKIVETESVVKEYIYEAVEAEKANL